MRIQFPVGFLVSFLWLASTSACSDGGGRSGNDCGGPATPIHEIQGEGRSSPLLRPDPGDQALVVEAVVVGSFPGFPRGLGGFFIQEEDDQVDGDPRTSEGLFVFDPAAETPVEVGDRVRVSGRVAEFFGLTELVEISNLVVCSRGRSVTAVELRFPLDDEADWEQWEGMRVVVDQPLFVTGQRKIGRYGEVELSAGGRLEQPAHRVRPGAAALDWQEENLRRRILLDDGRDEIRPEPTPYLIRDDGGSLRLGDSTSQLEGVLDFAFGRFRIQPTRPVHFILSNQRPELPPDVEGTLRVVSWNVENFMNGDGRGGGFPTRGPKSLEEFDRQRAKLTETLVRLDPDLAALVEVENDGTGSESAIAELVEDLNERTSGTPFAVVRPEFTETGPHRIAVAIVYRQDSLVPIGPPTLLDAQTVPGFDDRRNRPSLVQPFQALATGEALTIVVNHLKSKGSDCDSAGDPDEGDGQGDCNLTRTRAADAVARWLTENPTNEFSASVLLLGDFNAYPLEDPLRALALAGYVDLLSRSGGASEYTYVFDGQAGRLDYALAGQDLLPMVGGAGIWHTNADEPPVFDYRSENPRANDRPNPFRASDHDPVLVGLFPDADADGLTDFRDPCPDSDRFETIVLGACDSGIPNRLGDGGCSLSDELIRLLALDPEVADAATLVHDWLDLKIGEGDIEPADRSALLACVSGASEGGH